MNFQEFVPKKQGQHPERAAVGAYLLFVKSGGGRVGRLLTWSAVLSKRELGNIGHNRVAHDDDERQGHQFQPPSRRALFSPFKRNKRIERM